MPTPNDKELKIVLSAFINYLKEHGWVLKATNNLSVLFNIRDGVTLNEDSISGLFYQWANRNSYSSIDYADHWWANIRRRLTFVIGETFQPAAEPELFVPLSSGVLAVNTYKKYEKEEPANGFDPNPAPWIEFLERLFPAETDREIVCDWLAHMLQRPDQRPSWHLLFTGDTGTGKGVLFEHILTPLLSGQTASLDSFAKLTEKHSTTLTSNMLIHLDDVSTHSDSQMTRLKSILSEEWQMIRPLYETERSARVYTRIILSSNQPRPLRLDENERRWYAPEFMTHKTDRQETQQFIQNRLLPWVSCGGLDVLYEWLMARDLSQFNHKYVPQSDCLRRMISDSVSILEMQVREWVAENPAFRLETLQAQFSDFRNTQIAASHLTAMRYKKCQPYQKNPDPATGKTSKQWWWIPQDWTPASLRQHLLSDTEEFIF
ncbi:TPA: hypothetical protein QCD44_003447 [Enterobacter hormaechei]|uniref:DUF5906 domain-containing protein n=1 Tax=Enterobacter TaxID=547 RepID=UPI000D396CEB|nr:MULTISPECIES: DUF5906 domain-containing protein [Enterobacter]EJQ1331314.1 hypothetical protein [Cronobacter sakazakii]EJQ1501682.1 hypothetical protein [Cronobacter sakazakii]EJQ1510412.1 hypothetical protein [Cronobacter sakazakii]EJQ1521750.1 hypothetical protein [Cronobacter sakazakii]EJR1111909.1 hypothetical protein [Cronobacter sakazakii]